MQAKEKLKKGISVLIYPEATIPNKKEVTLGRFKDGAFRIAIDNNTPIVPVAIIGGHHILPNDRTNRMFPGKINVVFCDPISTEGMVAEDSEDLKQQVRKIILQKLDEYGYKNLS